MMLCFVIAKYVLLFLWESWDVFTHVLQGYFNDTGAIIWLPQRQWSNPEGYGKYQPVYNQSNTQWSLNHMHYFAVIMYCIRVKRVHNKWTRPFLCPSDFNVLRFLETSVMISWFKNIRYFTHLAASFRNCSCFISNRFLSKNVRRTRKPRNVACVM